MSGTQRLSVLWKNATEALREPVRGFRFARNLLKEGGHAIETPFTYRNRSFMLRTVIGFGDIINFIPDPAQVWNDPAAETDWQNCYKEYLGLHFDKLRSFLEAFKSQTTFWENGLKGIIGVANLYPAYQMIVAQEWLLLLAPVGSAAYLYFFGKVTAQKLVQLLWKVARGLFTISKKVVNKSR